MAVPTLAPTVTTLQRTSATSARISWDPIPHQSRNADLTGYHLSFIETVNGTCVEASSDTSLVLSNENVGFLTNLDPLKEYCARVAGATAYGVGVFGRLWKIPCKLCT